MPLFHMVFRYRVIWVTASIYWIEYWALFMSFLYLISVT